MKKSARSHSCARALVAAVVFAAFSWALLGSVSPQLHARIHADANQPEHVCAITLTASGNYEHAAQPPIVSAAQFDICFSATAALTPVWIRPLFLNAHLFAHAPPAYS